MSADTEPTVHYASIRAGGELTALTPVSLKLALPRGDLLSRFFNHPCERLLDCVDVVFSDETGTRHNRYRSLLILTMGHTGNSQARDHLRGTVGAQYVPGKEAEFITTVMTNLGLENTTPLALTDIVNEWKKREEEHMKDAKLDIELIKLPLPDGADALSPEGRFLWRLGFGNLTVGEPQRYVTLAEAIVPIHVGLESAGVKLERGKETEYVTLLLNTLMFSASNIEMVREVAEEWAQDEAQRKATKEQTSMQTPPPRPLKDATLMIRRPLNAQELDAALTDSKRAKIILESLVLASEDTRYPADQEGSDMEVNFMTLLGLCRISGFSPEGGYVKGEEKQWLTHWIQDFGYRPTNPEVLDTFLEPLKEVESPAVEETKKVQVHIRFAVNAADAFQPPARRLSGAFYPQLTEKFRSFAEGSIAQLCDERGIDLMEGYDPKTIYSWLEGLIDKLGFELANPHHLKRAVDEYLQNNQQFPIAAFLRDTGFSPYFDDERQILLSGVGVGHELSLRGLVYGEGGMGGINTSPRIELPALLPGKEAGFICEVLHKLGFYVLDKDRIDDIARAFNRWRASRPEITQEAKSVQGLRHVKKAVILSHKYAGTDEEYAELRQYTGASLLATLGLSTENDLHGEPSSVYGALVTRLNFNNLVNGPDEVGMSLRTQQLNPGEEFAYILHVCEQLGYAIANPSRLPNLIASWKEHNAPYGKDTRENTTPATAEIEEEESDAEFNAREQINFFLERRAQTQAIHEILRSAGQNLDSLDAYFRSQIEDLNEKLISRR